MTAEPLVAGVELGGTKCIVALGRGRTIIEQHSIPTRSPEETLGAAAAQVRAWTGVEALGIASFGPLQLARGAQDFGRMLTTPKPGWQGADIWGALTDGFDGPAAIDTDVNGAALAEYHWGARPEAKERPSGLCYLTIGTGVGGGLVVDGRPVHGAMHPEMGHVRVRRVPGDDFAGSCPFHGDCVEGLINGPALAARFGMAGDAIPDDDGRWTHVASDLAGLVATLFLTIAPEMVLIGGGIGMGRPGLLPMVRAGVVKGLGGYLPYVTAESVEWRVRQPALRQEAGPLGALALGIGALG